MNLMLRALASQPSDVRAAVVDAVRQR
jgi:hypothetical protein